MHLHQMSEAFFFGAPLQAIQEWLIRIDRLNWSLKLACQHYGLTSRAATRVNNDFKPVLRQRPQNIKAEVVVSWTQLVHIFKKEVKRTRSFHPGELLRFRFSGEDLRQQNIAHVMPVRNNFERFARVMFGGVQIRFRFRVQLAVGEVHQ